MRTGVSKVGLIGHTRVARLVEGLPTTLPTMTNLMEDMDAMTIALLYTGPSTVDRLVRNEPPLPQL